MRKYVDCHKCKEECDCDRTFLGGCCDGKQWEEEKDPIEDMIASERKSVKDVGKLLKEFSQKIQQAICDNTYPYFDLQGKPVNIWNTDGFDKIDEELKKLMKEYGV